jgi:hypothetical protein
MGKKVDVKFTAKGCDWHARGHLRGSPGALDALERVFGEIEKRHEARKADADGSDKNTKT